MRHLAPRSSFTLLGLALCARGAAGQARVVIQSARHDTLTAEAGSVVTTAFDVRNPRNEAIRAEPKVDVPKGWSVVVGASPFRLAANARDLWLVGVAPASTTPAGVYAIRAGVSIDGVSVLADSIAIRVPEHRGLEVFPGDAPSYAMAGDGYPVSFFVRNRGNVAATFTLRATTSLGPAPTLQRTSLTIQPGATATVSGRVANERVGLGWSTHENVVELQAQDESDTTVAASVSLRTTIVPRSRRWVDQLSTMPALLTVRAVGANTGVSPASLVGSGPLGPNSSTQVDFAFRAPVNGPSLFGERDEYRLAVTGDRYRIRLGDNLFGFSQLTSSWISGFGAEGSGELGPLTAGAYVKEARWTNVPGSERAVTVGTSTRLPFAVTLIGLDRAGTSGANSRMGAVASQARFGNGSLVEVETAMSDSGGIAGAAHRARLSGDYSRMNYDFSLTRGTTDFAGRDRGQTTGHAGFTARLADWMSLTANTSTLHYVPTLDDTSFSHVRSTVVEGSLLHDRLGLVYEDLSRADSGVFAALGGEQRGGRVRASLPLRWVDLSADVASGTAHRGAGDASRYTSASVTLHAPMRGLGSLDLFVQRGTGTLFELPGLTAATTATLQLPKSTNFVVSAYGNIQDGDTRLRYAQLNAEIGHTLRNGMALVLRDRFSNAPWVATSPSRNLFFVELRAPLRIPTGLVRTRGVGSARGRVFDQETGQGLSGVLVRLGSEAAVTDGQGRVSFPALVPGRYHASVDGAPGSRDADALLTGDVAIDVRAEMQQPANFALSLARGGRVRVDVRQFDFATTLANARGDSLVDAGGLASAMIALVGVRDTIYQVTNQDGVADFRDVPVGRWTVEMIGGTLPDAHAVEVDGRSVSVRANERSNVALRIIPRRRAIQFVQPSPVIVARPSQSPP